MQTFLPYADFARSAAVLDRQRLGKQRVEAKQILLALCSSAYGWQNHPAVRMWRGYEFLLADYGRTMCREWRMRGYEDSLNKFFSNRFSVTDVRVPHWLGNEAFHASHRSNLLRKFPQHYRQFWPDERDDIPYVWPTSGEKI